MRRRVARRAFRRPSWLSPPISTRPAFGAKLLGIREVVGTGLSRDVQGMGAPSFIQRAQEVSFMGNNYEQAGSVEQLYTPYDTIPMGLGQDTEAYDLRRPGAVREIKAALIALAKDRSDTLSKKWPDPAIETTWKQLQVDDVWDGPTADEYAAAISRLRLSFPDIDGPFVQATAVGPQPTGPGLELIAGGVFEHLGG